ncbi:acyl-CoA dehydrogenase family protein [Bacillus sp. PS06]|uniref:acyl-CoA dehydrogenase family protein n=1 Tax=Bacillus sp. PS06 TaxID=2764176 RepID=UPI0017867E1C|nr:acyl-CoA dehydrogenase family protein [Bacillus sp. PS06]MBD8067705.1 acyl-CoA/acyl-ACP dehydrogenase [Bacillus sp. PS06]
MTLSFIKTTRQQEIYAQIASLADTFSKRSEKNDEEGLFPFENIEDLKKIGYTALTVPKRFGGEGISLYEMLLFQERLAQGDGSTALAIGWHLGIMMDIEEKKDWKDERIASLASEVLKGALINRAATEPQTGSPTRGGKPQTSAKRGDGQWVVNGRKTFTTMSPALDYFLVIASIEGTVQVGEFAIHKDSPGVTVQETWDMISMRGTASHDLILENVSVTPENLVHVMDKRSFAPNGWLLHIPACYLGIAMAARNVAVQFATEYSPNSIQGTIKDLPNVQRLVGEMEAELIQARHFMYSVAQKWDEATDKANFGPELGVVKYVATNTALSVVDKAMRIVGARSLQRSNPLQRYYRDVRAGLHNPPMDDMTISTLALSAFKSLN